MRLIYGVIFLLLCSTMSHADGVYRHVDSAGRVTYSTKPSAGADAVKPAALPMIGRWEPRPAAQKEPTCENHGGVACDRGADDDGSVICLDSYKDSLMRFAENCELAKLSVLGDPQRNSDLPTEIKVTVKNDSAATANGVLASFILNKFDPPLLLKGPSVIEPFSVADYAVNTTIHELPMYRKLLATDIGLECGNCK